MEERFAVLARRARKKACAQNESAPDGGFRQDRGLFPRSHGTERGWSFRNAVVQGKRCGVREAPDSRWRGKPNTGPFLVGQAHGMKAGKFFMVSGEREVLDGVALGGVAAAAPREQIVDPAANATTSMMVTGVIERVMNAVMGGKSAFYIEIA